MNAARRYGVPVALPTQEALKAAGITFEGLQDADAEALNAAARASGGDMALAGSLTFNDAELGWIADWRLSHDTPHRWGIRRVTFDEAFRNAVRGSAQILSGNGEPN
jgi:hypothetical protein